MNCWRVQNLVAPFLDGELPDPESEALAAHLEECPGCADHVEAIAGLPDLPDFRLPPELEEELMTTFDDELAARIARSAEIEERPPNVVPLWSRLGSAVGSEVRMPAPMAGAYLAVVLLLTAGVAMNHQRVQQLEESVARREAIISALQEQASRQATGLGGIAPVGGSGFAIRPDGSVNPNFAVRVGATGFSPGAAIRPVSYDGPRVLR
jgi:anti-sigma factor RsiW